ncbi:acyl-CoA thioesterase [Kineococcus sp. R8]|uniref:thioesterase family protein n=1 Tax=Kineococcus siccus TaxID=2696567 RepID=UPI0014122579|nr:acyl-CoA thioesterase [Kineococcus siccus]
MTDDRYPYRRPFPTRWNDDDVFGHVNNTVYYAAMDTTVTSWLLTEAGVRLVDGDTIAVVRASSCEYEASVSYPDVLDVGLRAGRIGTTSVTWEFGLRRAGADALVARGRFVHVFLDRATRRPVPVPADLRTRVEASLVVTAAAL